MNWGIGIFVAVSAIGIIFMMVKSLFLIKNFSSVEANLHKLEEDGCNEKVARRIIIVLMKVIYDENKLKYAAIGGYAIALLLLSMLLGGEYK